MKEFIINWRIENIGYSWHKRGEEIVSPLFVADTLQNTAWTLRLVPQCTEYPTIHLKREENKNHECIFGCEFSCVSSTNLILYTCRDANISDPLGKGFYNFLPKLENLVQKSQFFPGDILTLRCSIWNPEKVGNEIGQCLGYTRLEIERVFSVDDMNPRLTTEKTVLLQANKENKLLMSVGIIHVDDGLKIEINPISTETIKFSTFKFSGVGRRRKPFKYTTTWLDKPSRDVWRVPFLKTENKRNKLKLTCELIYSTGEETKSIVNIKPCSFKFTEFAPDSVLSCVPSGKLCDCPSICKDLWDLYSNRILCDVELKTQTTSFWVHKVVLCARSPVFLAMLTKDMKEKTTNCVEIEDLGNDALEKFLSFLYTDNFEESEWNTVAELYYAADKYQVEQLKHICSSYFINNIDCALNVCELLMLADKHSDSHLKSKVDDYIVKRHEWIFSSSTWKEFSAKQPLLALNAMQYRYDKVAFFGSIEKDKPAKESLSHPNAFDDFGSLYESQALTDIVIQTTSTSFPAHKTILSAGSSTLRRVIQRGTPIDTLKMKDLEEETVSRLLLFLYTDSLGDMLWEDTAKLYHAAVVYQIQRLKMKCSCFFVENLNVSNANHLWKLAHEHRDGKLKSLVEDFIFLSGDEVTLSELRMQNGEVAPPQRIETRLSKRLRLENNC